MRRLHARFYSGSRAVGAAATLAVVSMGLAWLNISTASEPKDAPPQLVSTEGGGPKWATVADLAKDAEKGDAEACFQYAQLLEDGSPANKVPRDPTGAIRHYEKAAGKNHGPALFRLGKIYSDGVAGAQVDLPKSFMYFERAARQGVVEGKYNVGAMLVSGRGVKRSYIEGLAWLILAEKGGADANAVQQVRARLAGRPQDIEAAEKRALALAQEFPATGSTPKKSQ